MKMQVYALTRKGKLAHAGPCDFILETPTVAECRTAERAWRKWRNAYITLHPGSYPLRDQKRNGQIYVVIQPNSEVIRFDLRKQA